MTYGYERGQATVEAAALLPTLMLLLGLLMQPACLLYTRTVMHGAAAEAVRVLATSPGADEDCRDFVLRRLKAVPEVPLFHVGGRSDWDISFEKGSASVTVSITGHLRPLPLLGISARLLGTEDAVGIRVEVRVTERTRPGWLEGDYGSWVGMWG